MLPRCVWRTRTPGTHCTRYYYYRYRCRYRYCCYYYYYYYNKWRAPRSHCPIRTSSSSSCIAIRVSRVSPSPRYPINGFAHARLSRDLVNCPDVPHDSLRVINIITEHKTRKRYAAGVVVRLYVCACPEHACRRVRPRSRFSARPDYSLHSGYRGIRRRPEPRPGRRNALELCTPGQSRV